jgi:phosphate transport system substrate-binding protein
MLMNIFSKYFTKPLALLTTLASLNGIANTTGAASVKIDGSSTVYPIIEAVSEEFSKTEPSIRVTAGVSGTGGGFKKFIAKEIDICNASRPAKKEEITSLAKNGIKFEEIKVAYDGLSIVVNPKNTFVDYLSVEELAKIWGKDSKVKTWADIRPTWPAKPIKLYGPGTDSGTFDFFTEAINGKAQVSRSDYTKSENDNVLVQGVSGDENALAYFGHAYVEANKSVLKVVPVGSSLKTAITPTSKTIKDGTYKPLSRPLFVYVNKESLKKAEVKKFLTFMINNSEKLVTEVGYVPLQVKEYKEQTKILAR